MDAQNAQHDIRKPALGQDPGNDAPNAGHGGALTSDDLPEVVSPDTSPEVAYSFQEKYFEKTDEANAKIPVGYQEYSATDQFPQAIYPTDNLPSKPELSTDTYADPPNAEEQTPKMARGKRILGMKRNIFIAVVVVVVIILAAAIGGGVGGSRAAMSHSSNSSDSSDKVSTTASRTASEDSTSSMPQTSVSQTSAIAEPAETFLNNATNADNKFAFQSFSESNYSGQHTDILRDVGKSDIGFDVQSFVWKPSISNCCVTLCLNDTLRVGWTCDELYRKNVSETFLSIFVWCGQERDHQGSNAVCSTGKGPTDHT